jgi:hypothetical protein
MYARSASGSCHHPLELPRLLDENFVTTKGICRIAILSRKYGSGLLHDELMTLRFSSSACRRSGRYDLVMSDYSYSVRALHRLLVSQTRLLLVRRSLKLSSRR